jgi:hypothetical protein
VDQDLLCGLLGSGGVVGPFDEFAVLELRAGADERHDVRPSTCCWSSAKAGHNLPLRILVTTRQRPPEIPGILKMVEVSSLTREEMIELEHQ